MRVKKEESQIYQINATYRIDQDKLNFILQKKGGHKKDAKPDQKNSWSTIGFYQTVNQLYHALVEIGIKEVPLSHIKELNDKVAELHGLIDYKPNFAEKG